MTAPLLNCPGHSNPATGKHVEGCGEVEPITMHLLTRINGRREHVPVLVCPHCKRRLLPTAAEIERTRGGT